MNLTELGKNIIKNKSKKEFIEKHNMDKKILEPYKNIISSCVEFENSTQINIIDMPYMEDKYGNVIETQSLLLNDKTKFTCINYIYDLEETPEMYDPNKSFYTNPVKDGIAITPSIYNPMNFIPTKKIILSYSPETGIPDNETSFIHGKNVEDLKEKLKASIDKIFDNIEDYRVKGETKVMVHGIFNVTEPLIPSKKIKIICEVKQVGLNGTTILSHKPVYILEKFNNLYLEKFGNKNSISEEELNNFLKDATIQIRIKKQQ